MRSSVACLAAAAAGVLAVSFVIPAIGGAAPTARVAAATSGQHQLVVTGTVMARQRGGWKVGLAGTPSVLVANFPADQKVSGTVNVGNLPTTLSQLGFDSNGNLKTSPQGTQNVSVANAVTTQPALPATAFQFAASVTPDHPLIPAGLPQSGHYALTSLSAANPTAVQLVLALDEQDCNNLASEVSNGPIVVVPPGQTVELTFPQPWTLSTTAFTRQCLTISEPGAAQPYISIAGYTY
jgi:hypothetical protein